MSKSKNSAVPKPRRGRRSGASGTRQAILDAARVRFAQDGYAAATIRKIAAEAGVDAALVMQFYRSKEALFAAVMSIAPGALSRIAQAFEGPGHTLGERVTRAFFDVWEGDPQNAEPVLAMLRAAFSSEQAALQTREFVQARLLEQVGPRLRGDREAMVRAGFALSMLIGVVVGRRVVQVPALVGEDREALIRMLAPALQTLLTTRTGSPAGTA